MKKVLKSNIEAGSRESNEPRLLGSIVSEMLHGNSPLAIGYRQYIASRENEEEEPDKLFKDFYPNTEPGIDLKLITREPGRLPVGDSISCMLTHDDDYPTFNRPSYTRDFSFQNFCREAAEELLVVAGLIQE